MLRPQDVGNQRECGKGVPTYGAKSQYSETKVAKEFNNIAYMSAVMKFGTIGIIEHGSKTKTEIPCQKRMRKCKKKTFQCGDKPSLDGAQGLTPSFWGSKIGKTYRKHGCYIG